MPAYVGLGAWSISCPRGKTRNHSTELTPASDWSALSRIPTTSATSPSGVPRRFNRRARIPVRGTSIATSQSDLDSSTLPQAMLKWSPQCAHSTATPNLPALAVLPQCLAPEG